MGDLPMNERTVNIPDIQAIEWRLTTPSFNLTRCLFFAQTHTRSALILMASKPNQVAPHLISLHLYLPTILLILNYSRIMSEELVDRKPTLRFNYQGFSVGEQNKVEDTTSSVKQRKLYNCVSLSCFLTGHQLTCFPRFTRPRNRRNSSASQFI